MKRATKLHRLYIVTFGHLTEKATQLGISLRQMAKSIDYRGKVLRRGTPGAFGFDARPLKSAKTDRRGFAVAGNSRDRRFARRHPQHFSPAI